MSYLKKIRRAGIIAIICGSLALTASIIYIICHSFLSSETVSEVYTDKLFYYISWPLKKFAGLFPFSIAEVALYSILLLLVILILITLINTVIAVVKYIILYRRGDFPQRRSMLRPAALFGLRVFSLLCIILTFFIMFGGINYTGLTFAERAGYQLEESSVDELSQLCFILGIKASEARTYLTLNSNGTIDDTHKGYNPFVLIDDAEKAYENLPEEYDFLKRDYPSVKPAISSFFMSNIHISGIYPYIFPEAIVNINTPIMALPHTICHEMAHQRGFAREDEANYVAYLACIQSDNPLLIYSEYYTAFSYAMEQLYVYDQETWQLITEYINPGIITDQNQEYKYWQQFETIDSEITESVNDAYLSVMDVEDGVRSYGRMVVLLLAEAKRYYEIL